MRWMVSFALAMSLGAGPAIALSCVPQDVAQTFRDLDAAPSRYAIVLGTLDFDTSKAPPAGYQANGVARAVTAVPARLEGRALTRQGFVTGYAEPVSLHLRCFGPWCASATPGQEVLAFLNVDASPPSLEITPCGGHVFAATPKIQSRALSCFRGEACAPTERP